MVSLMEIDCCLSKYFDPCGVEFISGHKMYFLLPLHRDVIGRQNISLLKIRICLFFLANDMDVDGLALQRARSSYHWFNLSQVFQLQH